MRCSPIFIEPQNPSRTVLSSWIGADSPRRLLDRATSSLCFASAGHSTAARATLFARGIGAEGIYVVGNVLLGPRRGGCERGGVCARGRE